MCLLSYTDVLEELTGDVQPHDRVRLTLSSRSLHHEIWLPFMSPDELTADRVMTEVERVVQSNDTWLLEEIALKFIHAPLPAGGMFHLFFLLIDMFVFLSLSLVTHNIEIDHSFSCISHDTGAWSRSAAGNFAAFLSKKRCIIQIKNKDNLCCARAIVTAKAKLDNHPLWNSIRQGRLEQRHLARQLHRDAGMMLQ